MEENEMPRRRYNYEALVELKNELGLTFMKNYAGEKLTVRSHIQGKCTTPDCKNTFDKTFRSLMENKNGLCISCNKESNNEKMAQTNLERYGVASVAQLDEVKEKMRKTNMERRGVEHPMQSVEVQKKRAQNKGRVIEDDEIESLKCKHVFGVRTKVVHLETALKNLANFAINNRLYQKDNIGYELSVDEILKIQRKLVPQDFKERYQIGRVYVFLDSEEDSDEYTGEVGVCLMDSDIGEESTKRYRFTVDIDEISGIKLEEYV